MNRNTSLPFVFLGLLSLAGCSVEPDEPGPTGPVGPVATTALEAWPEAPSAPPLSRQQLARACASWVACRVDASDPVMVEICVAALEWSGERAIPISKTWLDPFGDANERVEFFAACVLDATSCSTVGACLTPREVELYCEEGGCRSNREYQVTCEGSIARMTDASGKTVERDCARALAACDVASPTGCTDRHPSQCPAPPPQPDRCDGDVRLGCDGARQISYRDCSRLGGQCAQGTDGLGRCSYGAEVCDQSARCDGGQLSLCVLGQPTTIDAPLICGD